MSGWVARLRGVPVAALVAGLVAGVVVLGGGGRLAMRAIALAAGRPPGFSLGGTLEVLVAGAWRGAVGGVVYLPVRRLIPPPGPWRGLALGAGLFALAVITLPSSLRGLAGALGVVPLALGLFGAVFLLYGLALDLAVRRWAVRRKET